MLTSISKTSWLKLSSFVWYCFFPVPREAFPELLPEEHHAGSRYWVQKKWENLITSTISLGLGGKTYPGYNTQKNNVSRLGKKPSLSLTIRLVPMRADSQSCHRREGSYQLANSNNSCNHKKQGTYIFLKKPPCKSCLFTTHLAIANCFRVTFSTVLTSKGSQAGQDESWLSVFLWLGPRYQVDTGWSCCLCKASHPAISFPRVTFQIWGVCLFCPKWHLRLKHSWYSCIDRKRRGGSQGLHCQSELASSTFVSLIILFSFSLFPLPSGRSWGWNPTLHTDSIAIPWPMTSCLATIQNTLVNYFTAWQTWNLPTLSHHSLPRDLRIHSHIILLMIIYCIVQMDEFNDFTHTTHCGLAYYSHELGNIVNLFRQEANLYIL